MNSIRMFWSSLLSRFDCVARWRDYEVRRRWLRCLLFAVDRAGCLLRRASSSPPAKPLRRILVVRPEHFGDLVLTLPSLQRLRAAFPDAQMTLLARPEYSEWLSSLGVADEVLAADVPWTRRSCESGMMPSLFRCFRGYLPRSSYDLAITLHGDLRTVLLARRAASEVAGYREGGGGFLLAISRSRDRSRPVWRSHLDLVSEIQVHYGGWPPAGAVERRPGPMAGDLPVQLREPYLILHPGAGQSSKLWFPERWVQVARAGQRWGWTIVLTGLETEHPLCARIAAQLAMEDSQPVLNLAGQTSLAELSTLVARARAVIAPDTGIIHLAAALGTPSIALFGPNNPRQWGYASSLHRSLVHPQPCSFCRLAHCPRMDAPRVCLRAISAAEVIAHLQQVVKGNRKEGEIDEDFVALPDRPPALSAS